MKNASGELILNVKNIKDKKDNDGIVNINLNGVCNKATLKENPSFLK